MIRETAIIAVAWTVGSGCASEPEKIRCFSASTLEPATVVPTQELTGLARLLGGADQASKDFPIDEVRRAREIHFYPGFDPGPHAPYFDQIDDPESCRIRRTFLNHDGGTNRTVPLSVPCDEYWRLVWYVDEYLKSRGSLPVGTSDLTQFVNSRRVEETTCSR